MIKFAEGSEAHYSVFYAIAERAYVVSLKQYSRKPEKVMVVGVDDNSIYCRPEPPDGSTKFIPYGNIEECVIL